MFTEFTIVGLGYLGYYKWKNRNSDAIKRTFEELMKENNLTYQIAHIDKSKYGYRTVVNLYYEGFQKLADMQEVIESTFGANVDIQQNSTLTTATINIITEKLSDDYPFKPIKCKPYELYLAKTYTMKDIIVSMKDLPHLLYSGINSSGKTYCLLTALTNLIYHHSAREIEIFLSQISAKKDLRKFKDCKQCRGYAPTLEESYEMFNYLYHTMLKRINMFNSIKDKYIDTIYEWNQSFPKRKMRIVYLAMDEFTAYMPDSLDSKEDAVMKEKCLDLLVKLIQQSRCAGIYVLTSLQRPDKESLPPRLKAQFNCRVSFKQPNIASSLVVCDSDKAFKLKPQREAIVNSDDEYLIKTLYLDNGMIQEFIKDSIDTSHRNYYNYKQLQENLITENDKTAKEVTESCDKDKAPSETKKTKSKIKIPKTKKKVK